MGPSEHSTDVLLDKNAGRTIKIIFSLELKTCTLFFNNRDCMFEMWKIHFSFFYDIWTAPR